jgi:hypothetical protein
VSRWEITGTCEREASIVAGAVVDGWFTVFILDQRTEALDFSQQIDNAGQTHESA